MIGKLHAPPIDRHTTTRLSLVCSIAAVPAEFIRNHRCFIPLHNVVFIDDRTLMSFPEKQYGIAVTGNIESVANCGTPVRYQVKALFIPNGGVLRQAALSDLFDNRHSVFPARVFIGENNDIGMARC